MSALSTLIAGCTATNPYFDPLKPHHSPQGFINNYPANPAYKRPETGFLNPGYPVSKTGLARIPPAHLCTHLVRSRPIWRLSNLIQPDPGTWIGHATFLLQTGSGLNILTDPVFEDRASPLPFAGPKRHQRPGLSITELPHIDAVLISHSHYDHLSLSSLKAIYAQKGGRPPCSCHWGSIARLQIM